LRRLISDCDKKKEVSYHLIEMIEWPVKKKNLILFKWHKTPQTHWASFA